jgi:type I protein arginine methyltransferase
MSDKYQLVRDFIPLLENLYSPIERDELISQVATETGIDRAQVADRLKLMLDSGIVKKEKRDAQSVGYSYSYSGGLTAHRQMLLDHARTNGFRKALVEVVRPGDVVVDVGAGTGILGFFAARAGAKRVVLVENTRVVEEAAALAKANHLDSVIELFRGDAIDFNMSERANVIVSEWIGYFLMEEYMFSAFTSVRDRCLVDGGTVVPRSARLYLAPIEDTEKYVDWGFGAWEAPMYGFDFRLGVTQQLKNLRYIATVIRKSAVVADPIQLMRLDCLRESMDSFHFSVAGDFCVERSCSLHGFAGWFELELSSTVLIDTSPFVMPTHWGQAYFPVPCFPVAKGDRISTSVTTSHGGTGPNIEISADVFRGVQHLHSFKHTYHRRR